MSGAYNRNEVGRGHDQPHHQKKSQCVDENNIRHSNGKSKCLDGKIFPLSDLRALTRQKLLARQRLVFEYFSNKYFGGIEIHDEAKMLKAARESMDLGTDVCEMYEELEARLKVYEKRYRELVNQLNEYL